MQDDVLVLDYARERLQEPLVCVEPVAIRVATAARLLGISKPKVYELIARQDFRGAFKLGGCTMISVAALREWVAAQVGDGE